MHVTDEWPLSFLPDYQAYPKTIEQSLYSEHADPLYRRYRSRQRRMLLRLAQLPVCKVDRLL